MPNKLCFMDACGSAPSLGIQVKLSCAATEAVSLLRSANGRLYSSNYGPQGRRVVLTTRQKVLQAQRSGVNPSQLGEREAADAASRSPPLDQMPERSWAPFNYIIIRARGSVISQNMKMYSSGGITDRQSLFMPLPRAEY